MSVSNPPQRTSYRPVVITALVVATGVAACTTAASLLGGHIPSGGGAAPAGRPAVSTATARPTGRPLQRQVKFPSADLSGKFEYAFEHPRDVDAVCDYAEQAAVDCEASLIDRDCKAPCSGCAIECRGTRKMSVSELKPDNHVIVLDALGRLDDVTAGGKLTEPQNARVTVARAHLLALDGHPDQELKLLDGHLAQHPAAIPVLTRRLELCRETRDRARAEKACTTARQSTKTASEDQRIEVLKTCITLHPENEKRWEKPAAGFAMFLPGSTANERWIYRSYLARECQRDASDHDAHCNRICICNDRPLDLVYTRECKRSCVGCREVAAEKHKVCGPTQTVRVDEQLRPLPAESQYHVPVTEPGARTAAGPGTKGSLVSTEASATPASPNVTPAAEERLTSHEAPSQNLTPAATPEPPHVDLSARGAPPPRADGPPIYKRSWFWIAVGAVAAGSVAVILLTRGGSQAPACPECTLPTTGVPTQ